MRPKKSKPLSAEKAKTVEPKESKRVVTKGTKVLTPRFASSDRRESAASSYTGSSRNDDDSPRFSSNHSDFSGSVDTDVMEEYTSAMNFDRDLRKRHGQACKQIRAGDFNKALMTFESILARMLERFGEYNERVGTALHNVGIANLRASKLEDARDAIEEAVRIRKRTLGAEDHMVADSLVELGIILLSLKQYEDSLLVFFEALAIRKAETKDLVLPEDIEESQLKLAKVLNNIGCVNYEMGKFQEGKEHFEKSIRLQKNALGELNVFSFTDPTKRPGFLTLASTMCNKGYIELEKNEFWQAIKTFCASLEIQRSLLGSDNKLVLSTLDNLAYSYLCQSSFDAALTTYEELLFNQEYSYSESSLDCAKTLRSVAYVQLIQANFEGALKTLCRLEDIQREELNPDSKHLYETRRLMGETNYQVMKHPGFGCFSCDGTDGADGAVDLSKWKPKKPINGSKMSGHRISYA